jgi:hypothetical protein
MEEELHAMREKKNQRKKKTGDVQPKSRGTRRGRSLTCLPRREHSHHPSIPPVFCSNTVSTSPFLKASSSGDSAMLSYKARATQFCNTQTHSNATSGVKICKYNPCQKIPKIRDRFTNLSVNEKNQHKEGKKAQ